jgi:hypothetical protein
MEWIFTAETAEKNTWKTLRSPCLPHCSYGVLRAEKMEFTSLALFPLHLT